MLEDDDERIERFQRVTRRIDPTLSLKVWRDAHWMCSEMGEFLDAARLISLDHDLELQPGETPDPGDGVVVVKALTLKPQTCPVIIHGGNGRRSEWMAGDFELASWTHRRVALIGERWIEDYWRVVAQNLLRYPKPVQDRLTLRGETQRSVAKRLARHYN